VKRKQAKIGKTVQLYFHPSPQSEEHGTPISPNLLFLRKSLFSIEGIKIVLSCPRAEEGRKKEVMRANRWQE
jgi:hypothetical protein